MVFHSSVFAAQAADGAEQADVGDGNDNADEEGEVVGVGQVKADTDHGNGNGIGKTAHRGSQCKGVAVLGVAVLSAEQRGKTDGGGGVHTAVQETAEKKKGN